MDLLDASYKISPQNSSETDALLNSQALLNEVFCIQAMTELKTKITKRAGKVIKSLFQHMNSSILHAGH